VRNDIHSQYSTNQGFGKGAKRIEKDDVSRETSPVFPMVKSGVKCYNTYKEHRLAVAPRQVFSNRKNRLKFGR
jgi:hypothetical protein